MQILKWFVGSCFIAVCVVFAISNRSEITLQFWPFQQSLSTQAGIIILLPTFTAFLLGCLWMSVSKAVLWRRARDAEKRVKRLQATLEEMEAPLIKDSTEVMHTASGDESAPKPNLAQLPPR